MNHSLQRIIDALSYLIIFFFFPEMKLGETEIYRSELANVRAELDPWENQLMDHKGKLEVASTERKLLNEKVIQET